MEEQKLIDCEFDRDVLKVMGCLVPDQTMKLETAEGKVWISRCKEIDEMSITTIMRNEKVVARFIYDYTSGEVKNFIY